MEREWRSKDDCLLREADREEREPQVVRQRGGDPDRLPGQGVRERDRRGVERKAAEAVPLLERAVERAMAVVGVADQRVVDMPQVAAHLVESAAQG